MQWQKPVSAFFARLRATSALPAWRGARTTALFLRNGVPRWLVNAWHRDGQLDPSATTVEHCRAPRFSGESDWKFQRLPILLEQGSPALHGVGKRPKLSCAGRRSAAAARQIEGLRRRSLARCSQPNRLVERSASSLRPASPGSKPCLPCAIHGPEDSGLGCAHHLQWVARQLDHARCCPRQVWRILPVAGRGEVGRMKMRFPLYAAGSPLWRSV